jgi:hypothetical protein
MKRVRLRVTKRSATKRRDRRATDLEEIEDRRLLHASRDLSTASTLDG